MRIRKKKKLVVNGNFSYFSLSPFEKAEQIIFYFSEWKENVHTQHGTKNECEKQLRSKDKNQSSECGIIIRFTHAEMMISDTRARHPAAFKEQA